MKDGMYKQWNILNEINKKKEILPCDNMDETWGHCSKWNKSDRTRQQIPWDLTYMWGEKNLIHAEFGGCQRGRGKMWVEQNEWKESKGTNFHL